MFKGLYNRFINSFKKGGRGFTLVELMIVIAVIAILALVLIPRIGLIKNKSKEAGIKANMAMLEGEIQNVIDNFDLNSMGAHELEVRVAADINNALQDTEVSQKMRNPVSGVTGAIEQSDIASTGGAVVYLDTTDDTDGGGAIDGNWTQGPSPNYKGIVGYAAYYHAGTGKLRVQLIPYDAIGNRIDEMIKTISQ